MKYKDAKNDLIFIEPIKWTNHTEFLFECAHENKIFSQIIEVADVIDSLKTTLNKGCKKIVYTIERQRCVLAEKIRDAIEKTFDPASNKNKLTFTDRVNIATIATDTIVTILIRLTL
jgi:hypothetical protein